MLRPKGVIEKLTTKEMARLTMLVALWVLFLLLFLIFFPQLINEWFWVGFWLSFGLALISVSFSL